MLLRFKIINEVSIRDAYSQALRASVTTKLPKDSEMMIESLAPGTLSDIQLAALRSDTVGKFQRNLLRLLTYDRFPIGVDFVKTLLDATQIEPFDRDLLHLLGYETRDNVVFWTYAPYILHEMTGRGMPAHEAMRRILDWAREAGRLHNADPQLFSEPQLRGFEGLRIFYLTGDENNPTHLFARRYACQVIDEGYFKDLP
jgi:hypothetical protein